MVPRASRVSPQVPSACARYEIRSGDWSWAARNSAIDCPHWPWKRPRLIAGLRPEGSNCGDRCESLPALSIDRMGYELERWRDVHAANLHADGKHKPTAIKTLPWASSVA